MRHLKFGFVLVGSISLFAVACGGSQPNAEAASAAATASGEPVPPDPSTPATVAAAAAKKVEVTVQPKSGSKLSGKAILTEMPEGVKVVLTLEGLTPGEHGAHVHEKGDCSAPDGSSAGGHFNPAGNPHALPTTSTRHLGDLGNITVTADGKGALEIVAPGANLKDGDASSFLGKSIIIHEKKDDGGQPTGNAGGRVGCAEIK